MPGNGNGKGAANADVLSGFPGGNGIGKGNGGPINSTAFWKFGGDSDIFGTDDRDVIHAGGGDDTVTGGAGSDQLMGGDGSDTAVFSGNLSDYDFTQLSHKKIIVEGPDGTDRLKDFEFLQFDDYTVDLAVWNFEGNNAPLTNPTEVTLFESEDVATDASVGPQEVGNIGLWYIFDFDTGEITVAVRDNNTSKTTQDAADTYLSNGNGLILHPNTNDSNWVFWAASFADGVETAVAPTDIQVTDLDGGPMHQLDSRWVTFGDSNQLVDEIRVEVTGIELADGRVVDVVGTLSNIDYEINDTDDMIVESASFSMVTNTDTPAVLVTADVYDPDGDELVFAVDTSGTLGTVVNNGDGTFIYDAGDAFEYLDAGETATDSFDYSVDDGAGGVTIETVTITILGADELFV